MLDQWLESLPKPILVGGILIIGLILIYAFNPPHSVCHSQMEIFKKNLTPWVFNDRKLVETSKLTKSINTCKAGNTPGSCLEMFDYVRRTLTELESMPLDCHPEVGTLPEVKRAVTTVLSLLIEIAWGTKPPADEFERQAWFDTAHLSTICDLTRFQKSLYGEEEWLAYVDTRIQSLPEAATLPRDQAWAKMILSVPCRR
ncbi:MAG: hypothetical protein K2X47_01920 [Bdellovibrionales bacterium]|nr:hypothetical protein [Bdellovibrionales bacterium]